MKFVTVLDLGVRVDLDATDCLTIADALRRWPIGNDNGPRLWALTTAFDALAVLAAADTNMDNDTPPSEWAAKTRQVWRPRDEEKEASK